MGIVRIGLLIVLQLLTLNWWAGKENRATAQPLKILLISDLNGSYGSTSYGEEVHDVIAKIDSIKPDLILCAGDMVAGQKSSLTTEQIQAMWDGFDSQIFQKIEQSNVAFAFTIGNHDGSPNFLQDRALATAYWMPRKNALKLNFIDDTHFPYYYSFEQSGIFIASWDASASVVKEDVYKWLETQLASPVAKKARMRILLGHLPLYAIVESKNKPGEVNADASFAMSFFKKHKVDMYISGHQHAYYPAKEGNVVLLHAGGVGDGPRQIMGHAAEAMRAYSILEIPKNSKQFKLETWNPSLRKSIALEDLPASVSGFNGTVNRLKKL